MQRYSNKNSGLESGRYHGGRMRYSSSLPSSHFSHSSRTLPQRPASFSSMLCRVSSNSELICACSSRVRPRYTFSCSASNRPVASRSCRATQTFRMERLTLNSSEYELSLFRLVRLLAAISPLIQVDLVRAAFVLEHGRCPLKTLPISSANEKRKLKLGHYQRNPGIAAVHAGVHVPGREMDP